MKKSIKISLIIIGILLLFWLIAVICIKQRARKENQESSLRIQSINAERVIRDLGGNGDVSIEGDRVVITDLEFKEASLILRINFYNATEGKTLSLEQVMEQFEIYTIDYEFLDENTEELKNFCAFIEEEGIVSSEANLAYEQYKTRVNFILADKQTNITTATPEQLEEACQKALED